jgi:hypothetical protein
MERSQAVIDFRELVSSVPGEGLELLVRQIGQRQNLSPSSTGRGADAGRDLFFTELLSGPISKQKIKWLVSCKDKAISNESVKESDLPAGGVSEKLEQHKADGFLLVTTTVPSTATKEKLDKLDKSAGGKIYTFVWDKSDLTAILLQPENHDLLKQFLPESYKRVKGLTSLEGAILAYRDELPDSVLADVMRMVNPYASFQLKGLVIWPFDPTSARTIDAIIRKLIIDDNVDEAVAATEKIEFDAFMTMLGKLYRSYPEECYKYLMAISTHHQDTDLRYNAIQFLVDTYRNKIPPAAYFRMAVGLDPESVEALFSLIITKFVQEELIDNTNAYELGDDLEGLSSATVIDEVEISSLSISTAFERIDFDGTLDLELTLQANDREGGISDQYPGEFCGYFDSRGMYLTSATVDTSSFYGPP